MSEKIPPKVNPANHPARQSFASSIEHSHFDAWRVFRIMSEFVESFEDMADIETPLITVFGSARTPRITPTPSRRKRWADCWRKMVTACLPAAAAGSWKPLTKEPLLRAAKPWA